MKLIHFQNVLLDRYIDSHTRQCPFWHFQQYLRYFWCFKNIFLCIPFLFPHVKCIMRLHVCQCAWKHGLCVKSGFMTETELTECPGTDAGQSFLQSWLMGHSSAEGRLLAHGLPCTGFCYSSRSTAIFICYKGWVQRVARWPRKLAYLLQHGNQSFKTSSLLKCLNKMQL